MALREYNLLRTLNHPGVIKMIDAYVNNARETIYLVMDLIDGLSLKQFVTSYIEKNPDKKSPIGGLPEQLCKSIIQ